MASEQYRSQDSSELDLTTISASLHARLLNSLSLEPKLDDTTLPTAEPMSGLGRILSRRAVVSTTSNFTERDQAPIAADYKAFEVIGAGMYGTILTADGSPIVFKMAKHRSGPFAADLLNECKMHQKVLSAVRATEIDGPFPWIPYQQAYISRTNEDWWSMREDFVAAAEQVGVRTPCDVLCLERIASLPLEIRSYLIDRIAPERLRDAAHQDPSNESCLARVFLGSRKEADDPCNRNFSLRNYAMYLDQMIELGMDVKDLACSMASALAVMHWKAHIDAKDVEFVLGLSPAGTASQIILDDTGIEHLSQELNFGHDELDHLNWHPRLPTLWLIDFNLCSEMTMDESGVAMAVEAWQANVPYYPKPLQENILDQELWTVFVTRYLEVSDQILQPTMSDFVELPRNFIRGIVHSQLVREALKEKFEQAADELEVNSEMEM